jgi:hypothetical protein
MTLNCRSIKTWHVKYSKPHGPAWLAAVLAHDAGPLISVSAELGMDKHCITWKRLRSQFELKVCKVFVVPC